MAVLLEIDEEPVNFPSWTTVTYVFKSCAPTGDVVSCGENYNSESRRLGFEFTTEPCRDYYIYIDGKQSTDAGGFELTVTASPL
jgi:hypothetical protein